MSWLASLAKWMKNSVKILRDNTKRHFEIVFHLYNHVSATTVEISVPSNVKFSIPSEAFIWEKKMLVFEYNTEIKPLYLINPIIGIGEGNFSSYIHTHTQKTIFLFVAIILKKGVYPTTRIELGDWNLLIICSCKYW